MPGHQAPDRERSFWYVSVDQSVAGETEIQNGAVGQQHCVVGWYIVPDGAGTFQFLGDTDAGGAGTETALTGVMKMQDGVVQKDRGSVDAPCLVATSGRDLCLETGTATVSGYVYGYTISD